MVCGPRALDGWTSGDMREDRKSGVGGAWRGEGSEAWPGLPTLRCLLVMEGWYLCKTCGRNVNSDYEHLLSHFVVFGLHLLGLVGPGGSKFISGRKILS